MSAPPAMLVNCTRCGTALQLPPGAKQILCMVCNNVIDVASPPPQDQPRQGGYPGQYGTQPQYPPPQPYATPPQPYAPPPYSSYGTPPASPPPYAAPGPYGQMYGQPPPPNPLVHTPAPPNLHGRKKAVIIGISYKGSRYELKGCINDARCMKYMLTTKMGFSEQQILMLNEEDRDPLRIPTRTNIMNALYWLVQGQQLGDSLVFHYSGHGGQKKNRDGSEIDGFDETLCPVDFEQRGQIVDDELNATIVRPLQPGVRLHAIIDACHSGTVLDLDYLCQINRYNQIEWQDHRGRTYKGTSGGEVFSFSGCEDHQTSADTAALSKTVSTGAMTFSFIQAVERNQARTYGELLTSMRRAIKEANAKMGGGMAMDPVGGLLGMLLGGGFVAGGAGSLTQNPQLTSDKMFDVNRPFYI